MRLPLVIHPSSHSDAVRSIFVDVDWRADGRLVLHYEALGKIDGLLVPEHMASMRTDELWRHTCFEIFIKGAWGETYREYNFSPSGQWACYDFVSHRKRTNNPDVVAPGIGTRRTDGSFELTAALTGVAPPTAGAPVRVGLSVIVEQTDGIKSYWALAHPPEQPDFHHADCFALRLPAADSV